MYSPVRSGMGLNFTLVRNFNLVSIYEARRSIEMSESMKRLSWITVRQHIYTEVVNTLVVMRLH